MNISKIQQHIIPNTILDIGANIGQFYTECRKVFPNSYIFSIEATRECEYELSKVNPNYLITALYKENTTLNFYKRKNDLTCTGNSIYREQTNFYNDDSILVEKIDAIKLDDVFTDDSSFDLIKIDTQGSELDIIAGGLDLCKRSKYILLEVSIEEYNKDQPLIDEVDNFMINLQYEKVDIIGENFHPITGKLIQYDILYKNKDENYKRFKAFGVASNNYDVATAKAMTYTDKNNNLISTPLIFKENPFNEEIKNLKYIFEIGCGTGRNIKWVLENTDAIFIAVEPNPSMISALYEIYPEYKNNNRVMIYSDFKDIDRNIKFDLILSTFVFQHIGYMPSKWIYNVSDIVNEISRFTHSNTIWILLEHDSEDDWIGKFIDIHNINLDVYIRGFKGIEELTHRDHCTIDGHHLMIFKGDLK